MWQKNPDENVLMQAFLAEGVRLKAAGCDGFIIASHTLSWLGDHIQSQLGLNHVSLYEALFKRLRRLGAKRVGLTGTRYTMGDAIYRSRYTEAGFDLQVPDEPYFTGVASIVFKELVHGVFKDESRTLFYRCFDHVAEKGVDAIVLGCTEIGLLVRERTWPVRGSTSIGQIALVDLIESHAAASVEWMLQN
jgi:aspartate racemase